MSELHWLPARAIARLVNARKVSAVEVAHAALDRLEELNPRVNAFITVTREHAIRAAMRVDRTVKSGRSLPLAGVPLGVKDLFATRGIRTTCGSKMMAEHVPDFHATVVARLQQAGAVMVGKCNLHEFAFGFTNLNPHFGAARNPWDPARVTGGSSGGSAAAVAAGLCPIALGSDTGGSIRLPASLCGLVGLKPTYGRVSRHGATPLAWSLDHIGPMTRTVEDAALMLEVIAGPDARDSSCVPAPVTRYSSKLMGSLDGLRLGVPTNYFFEVADAEVSAAVASGIRALRQCGATVTKVPMPHMEAVVGAHRAIIFSEAATVHGERPQRRPHDYGPDVLNLLRYGMLLSATDYLRAQSARRHIIADWRELWREFDLLVVPTASIPACRLEEATVRLPGESRPKVRVYVGNTLPFNLSGQPAISLPCGFTQGGLPIGMQLVARPFEEDVLLRAAYAYERSAGWHTRRPPGCV